MNLDQQWLTKLGDNYYERNVKDYGSRTDPVSVALKASSLKPKRVLEIGCGNGWRLQRLHKEYGCTVRGVDPSPKAVEAGNKIMPGTLVQGVASTIPFADGQFDLVIYGFCLWLCHPTSWLRIVSEGDRVLSSPGVLIIHDHIAARASFFNFPEYGFDAWVYDWPKLWLSHPSYSAALEVVSYEKGFIKDGKTVVMPEVASVLSKTA